MRVQFGTLLLSITIAVVLWFMSSGTSSIERSVDVPILFDGVPENLVITGQSADAINIRVQGNRAALRNVSPTRLEYRIDISEARSGPAVYEVDTSRIDQELPRGARIVSRSPASIEVFFERRGRKSLRVRPDVAGEPAQGFRIASVAVDPPNVWVTGARSDVLRLSEVVTDTIDVAGADKPIEREIGLSLGSDHVWREEAGSVTVRIQIEPLPADESEGEGAPS